MMGRGWDYDYGVGGASWVAMLLSALFIALIVAGVIALIIWAVRSAGGHGGGGRYATHGPRWDERDQGRGSGSGYDILGPRSEDDRYQRPGDDRYRAQEGRADDAVEIARRRFAAGEITKEQYDDIVDALRR